MSCESHQVTLADSFFSELAHANSRLLLLNYEAAVAPFRMDPYGMISCLRVAELLQNAVTLRKARVAVITESEAIEAAQVFSTSNRPEIWGSDGLEQLSPDGTYKSQELDDVSYESHALVVDLLMEQGLSDRIEIRPGSISVRWTGLTENAIFEVARNIQRIHFFLHLPADSLVSFHGGLEIRLSRASKQNVVHRFLREAQETDVIVYLGDFTDEGAFRALKGRGLSVLVRPEYRASIADLWLSSVEEVIYFLQLWISACTSTAQETASGEKK